MTSGGPWRYEPTRGLALWGAEEVAAATEVLAARSPFRYYGPDPRGAADAFEHELGAALGVEHVVGVHSGTAALAASLIALGLPAGAEVVVPAVTFVGCVNAVVWARGVPVFAEVDDTLTLDPARVEEVVTERTWGVMPVHLLNAAADMVPLVELCARRGLAMIEDAAQATGVEYHGRRVGGFGDAAAFSFQLEKNITAGEGGAVACREPGVADRVVALQDQGGQFTTSAGRRRGPEVEPTTGMNLRMSEVTAALLSVQLRRLDPMLARLRAVAAQVRADLADLPVQWRRMPDEKGSGGDLTLLLGSRLIARDVVAEVTAAGIPAYTLYAGQPVYANPAVRAGATPWGTEWSRPPRCRDSESYLGRSVTVGLGARMTDDDVAAVSTALRAAWTATASR